MYFFLKTSKRLDIGTVLVEHWPTLNDLQAQLLQEFAEEVQYIPELLVQVVEPQAQSALFSVLPA